MKCIVCESEIPVGSKVCPICGSEQESFKEPETAAEVTAPAEQPAVTADEKPPVQQKEEEKKPSRVVRKVESAESQKDNIQENARQAAKSAAKVAKGVANLAIESAKNIKINTGTSSLTSERALSSERAKKNGRVGPFVLAENEVPIKRYMCADLGFGFFKKSSSTGYLYVTNQRIMYYGSDENSEICMEAPISSIGGITTFLGNNRNTGQAILGGVLIVLGLAFMTSCMGSGAGGFVSMLSGIASLAGLVLVGLGILQIYLSRRKAYLLQISSNAVNGTAIMIGEGPQGNVGHNKSLYTLAAVPTKDTEIMISEIGALIHDIQMLGDGAIAIWKDNASSGYFK